MDDVTEEQVKTAALSKGIPTIDHHRCSFCNTMVYYFIQGEDLFFNPGCGCSWSPPTQSSWQYAADWINMQSNSEIKIGIAKRFGLED